MTDQTKTTDPDGVPTDWADCPKCGALCFYPSGRCMQGCDGFSVQKPQMQSDTTDRQPRYVIMCDACEGLGHDDDWAWPRTCSVCRGTGCVAQDDDDYSDDDWQNDNVAMNDDPGI